MDPRYPPSKRREPVRKDRIILRTSLETAIGQVSGFSLLKDPRDHARDRKQSKLLNESDPRNNVHYLGSSENKT